MPRMPKAVTTTTDAPVAEKAPKTTKVSKETAAAPAEKAPKASKEPKGPKEPKAKKEVVVPSAVDVSAPVVEGDVPVDVEASFTEKSDEFVSKIQQVTSLLTSLKADYRVLAKQYVRDLKAATKQGSKRKRKTGTRSPSGFVKPTRISDELASFLEKPAGTEMARTDVTRDINKYIRTHNLQDKENGRKINPDTKLAGLLKLNKDDELTYFNLQKYMSPHFAKAVKAVATA